jgi:hypothetical protein
MALQDARPPDPTQFFDVERTREALRISKELQRLECSSREYGPSWFLIEREPGHVSGFKVDVGFGTLPQRPDYEFRYVTSVQYWTCCLHESSCVNSSEVVGAIRRVARSLLPDVYFPPNEIEQYAVPAISLASSPTIWWNNHMLTSTIKINRNLVGGKRAFTCRYGASFFIFVSQFVSDLPHRLLSDPSLPKQHKIDHN